jgi:hypothetical protein
MSLTEAKSDLLPSSGCSGCRMVPLHVLSTCLLACLPTYCHTVCHFACLSVELSLPKKHYPAPCVQCCLIPESGESRIADLWIALRLKSQVMNRLFQKQVLKSGHGVSLEFQAGGLELEIESELHRAINL